MAAVATAPVLIDLGLAKDLSAVRGHAGESLSIVDGQAVGVGTPRYAAPEQMSGDDVSPATDVYALGMLANDCFDGNPPRAWRRIIQRATAAVPAHRYATTEAFARAVELVMIWRQSVRWIGGILFGAILVGLGVFTFRPSLSPNMNLEGKKVIIRKPILLDGGKTYCVTGPGTLDADISGSTGTILKLKNCVLLNRTKNLYPKNGVHYKLEKSAYLNFIDVRKRPVEFDWAGAFDIGNDFNNKIYFGGPETLQEVHDLEGHAQRKYRAHAPAHVAVHRTRADYRRRGDVVAAEHLRHARHRAAREDACDDARLLLCRRNLVAAESVCNLGGVHDGETIHLRKCRGKTVANAVHLVVHARYACAVLHEHRDCLEVVNLLLEFDGLHDCRRDVLYDSCGNRLLSKRNASKRRNCKSE